MIIDKLGAGHYQTRNGLLVVILCLDAPGDNPVIGYVIDLEGKACSFQWTKSGIYSERAESSMNLIPVPRKPREVWISKRSLEVSNGFHNAIEDQSYIEQPVLFREVMEDENA